MKSEEANKKEGTMESTTPVCGPMGQGMFEMMKACCGGEGGCSDFAAMMKDKMGAMANMSCCGQDPGKSAADKGSR